MSSDNGISGRKLIPGKLEEDLKNVSKYKVGDPSKNMKQILDDSVERAMYDEMFGGLLQPKPADARSKPNIAQLKNDLLGSRHTEAKRSDEGSGGGNSDVFLKRLEQVEAEARALRGQVAKLTLANGELKSENRALTNQLNVYNVNGDLLQESRMLRKENEDLRHELEEMHSFLSDYGLAWVGHGSASSAGEGDETEGEAAEEGKSGTGDEELSKENIAESKRVFQRLSANVKLLNDQSTSAPAVVKTSGDASSGGIRKARLVHAGEDMETIKLAFYLNGIMINRGPFRHKSSQSYAAYVQDIADGYFPMEYKTSHPDGVLFDLTDRHDVNYKEGGGGLGSNYDREMKAGQLLQRLPKTTIRNGEIVHTRDDVARILGGDAAAAEGKEGGAGSGGGSSRPTGPKGTSKNPIVLETSAWKEWQQLQHDASGSDAKQAGGDSKSCSPSAAAMALNAKISTIQIRLAVALRPEAGACSGTQPAAAPVQVIHTLQLKMFATDCVADVAAECAKYLNREVEADCGELSLYIPEQLELRNSYPSRVLDHAETLQEAGFLPNGSMTGKLL